MILDLSRPYVILDRPNADYIEQDGVVYGWSESNVCYEWAWFLYFDAVTSKQIKNILKDRPFPFPDRLPLRGVCKFPELDAPTDPYTLDHA